MTTRNQLRTEFEERFHQKWTSLSLKYHFKALASKIFHIPFNEVLFHLDERVSDDELEIFRQFMQRLERDEPLQHIIEETEFMGFPILCSRAGLIPRPETEELVELILRVFKNDSSDKHFLDICTGTGCIAIALQKFLPKTKVSALDYFEDTLELARKNFKLNEVGIELMKLDVLHEMNKLPKNQFDAWVANPPYIPESDKEKMEKNVLEYEPSSALFVSNEDPLCFYRIITESATKTLKENGWLFFEIHEDFGKEMIALLEENNFKNIDLVKDMQGKNRMIYGQKLSK